MNTMFVILGTMVTMTETRLATMIIAMVVARMMLRRMRMMLSEEKMITTAVIRR